MLTINFGQWSYSVDNPDVLFDSIFEPDWLEDELVKQMIKDVDKSEVLSPYCIQSPVLGQIPLAMLSGGVKTLIMMLKQDEYKMELCNCGPNCEKWIVEIGKRVDRECTIETFDLFTGKLEFEFLCKNDGDIIRNASELTEKLSKYTFEAGDCIER